MTAEPSDETLMQAYANGDARAFEQLYARHRGPLFRFVLRNLRVRAQAEEVFQEVWMRLVTARTRYRVEARFSTWLYRIALNLIIDHGRRQKPEHNGESAETALRLAADGEERRPDHTLSDFEQRRRLQLALEELPEDQRIAILLRLEQELSLEEIGELTGAGRETVKSRLRYAMDKLRARLSP
jgi:RNA polymerase sigma factor (sigma-70 family)